MNNLTKIRGKHGMTQTDLGNKLGVTRACVSYFEKDVLTVKTAEKIAEILNENIFDIMGSDVLKVLPKTEQDKKILIDMIKSL